MARKSKALLEAEARIAELTGLLDKATAPVELTADGLSFGAIGADRGRASKTTSPTREEFALAHKGSTAKSMCAAENCREVTAGKSKYCREHRKESRARFKAMLAGKAEAKSIQYERFGELLAYARAEAGKVGGAPAPGYVRFAPGNTAFVYWARENVSGIKRSEGGGVILPLKASADAIRTFAAVMARGLQILEPRVTVSLSVQ